MTLPVLLSVSHAGTVVPAEAQPYCRLTREEIIADGDEQAAEIYLPLAQEVQELMSTDIARAIVDLNREENDRSPDGAIKTHTCWNVPVYDPPLPEAVAKELIAKYHRPYHVRLRDAASHKLLIAIDCHTMAAQGPPIGPDTGSTRPPICLGDVRGESLPAGWTEVLAESFRKAFELEVTVNDPFAGGYITRTHMEEMPWVQLEFSRGDFLTITEKRAGLLRAIEDFCRQMG